MLKLTTLIFLLIFSQASLAGSKDCTSKKNAPLCPNSGATILDETYPTQTFVVSTQGYHTNDRQSAESNTKLPADFITSIIESYKSDKPEIIVPSSETEFADLLKKVEENLTKSKKSPKHIQQQLSLIKHVENTSYTWQQDYFESFISEETGRPVVREVDSYGGISSYEKKTSLTGFKAMSGECPVEVGEPLKDYSGSSRGDPKTNSWGNGEMVKWVETLKACLEVYV